MTELIVADIRGACRAALTPPRRAIGRGRGYGRSMRRIRTVLLDIDGVLTVSWRPLPGAVEAVNRLRAAGLAVALVTNTTSRTRAWMASTLSAAGFPVAAGVQAVVTGKPAAAFFATVLDALGADAPATVMVGDDIQADVLAAQDQGITGVLVRTGKYRPEAHPSAPGVPGQVIDSVSELPACWDGPASNRSVTPVAYGPADRRTQHAS